MTEGYAVVDVYDGIDGSEVIFFGNALQQGFDGAAGSLFCLEFGIGVSPNFDYPVVRKIGFGQVGERLFFAFTDHRFILGLVAAIDVGDSAAYDDADFTVREEFPEIFSAYDFFHLPPPFFLPIII